jgi:cytochrome b
MNATSSSRAERAPAAVRNITVWDLPVRLFHWLMVLSFTGAYLTAESERWRLVHITLGYTLGALVAFRVLWGLFGTRYARFAEFVRGPAAVRDYLAALFRGRPRHFLGHNPAGALAILALLGLGAAVVGSGWAALNELGGDVAEEAHELLANVMLGLVLVHIVAVVISSRLHRENLVAAMIDGRKAGAPEQGIRRRWRVLGLLLLAAVLGFWWWQWQAAPISPTAGTAIHERHGGDDD